MTIRFDSLRRRASARNVSSLISLRWPIHVNNPVDTIKLSYVQHSHRRSTTVSLETYPLSSNVEICCVCLVRVFTVLKFITAFFVLPCQNYLDYDYEYYDLISLRPIYNNQPIILHVSELEVSFSLFTSASLHYKCCPHMNDNITRYERRFISVSQTKKTLMW